MTIGALGILIKPDSLKFLVVRMFGAKFPSPGFAPFSGFVPVQGPGMAVAPGPVRPVQPGPGPAPQSTKPQDAARRGIASSNALRCC